ncbi:MAG: hypothetical protein KAR09_01325, partial [Bacteroidales bacterium]|nr:hypothetical protein [Bacteroidales bacterium]
MERKDNIQPGFEELRTQSLERLKELSSINRTISITKEGKPINETLQKIAHILPTGWQYPEFTSARIIFEDEEYRSNNFLKTNRVQKQDFETIDNKSGSIEIYYSKSFPKADEGTFLKEERDLIINLANIISGYLSSVKGQAVLKRYGYDLEVKKPDEQKEVCSITSMQLLQRFLNKNNYDRDIYHDLMPFKVCEILLIANLYDAYIIEKEGHFSDQIMGEYAQLSLTSLPRITGVSTVEEAEEQLNSKHFDLVIIMVGVNKRIPIFLSQKIKKAFPYIPVFLLLNNNS